MPGQIALAAIKLVAPLGSHTPIEVVGDGAIQLVDIDRFQPLPQAIALRSQMRNCFIVVVPFNLEAVPQRFNDKIVNLLIEP
ncbi:MAG: hypothetical protein CMN60_05850 [Sphingobium sp.]|nr:hypothetical protein [Sphingobium sp.]